MRMTLRKPHITRVDGIWLRIPARYTFGNYVGAKNSAALRFVAFRNSVERPIRRTARSMIVTLPAGEIRLIIHRVRKAQVNNGRHGMIAYAKPGNHSAWNGED